MKILFIANRFPYPPFRGDKLKIYNLATQLSKTHELTLITFAESESDFQYMAEVQKVFKHVEVIRLPKWKSFANVALGLFGRLPLQVNYFKSQAFDSALTHLLTHNKYDAVHVQHLRMAQFAMNKKGIRRILDLPDAFSLYWQRRKAIKRNVLVRLLDNIESKRV